MNGKLNGHSQKDYSIAEEGKIPSVSKTPDVSKKPRVQINVNKPNIAGGLDLSRLSLSIKKK